MSLGLSLPPLDSIPAEMRLRFEREFNQQAAIFAKLGVSREAYLRSRALTEMQAADEGASDRISVSIV